MCLSSPLSLVSQVHVGGAAAAGAEQGDAAGGGGAPEGLCGDRDGPGGALLAVRKVIEQRGGYSTVRHCTVLCGTVLCLTYRGRQRKVWDVMKVGEWCVVQREENRGGSLQKVRNTVLFTQHAGSHMYE